MSASAKPDGGAAEPARVAIPRKGSCLGCLILIGVLAACFGGWAFIDWLAAAEGTFDPGLDHDLESMLGFEWERVSEAPQGDPFVKDSLVNGVFEDRVRYVRGWDQIVLIAPHQSGALVADDPALTSWWLRHRIRNTGDNVNDRGIVDDGMYRLFAIRAQQVVVDLAFRYEQAPLPTMLLSREP